MAQINSCLKRIFTVFNIIFAIVGGVIIGLALLAQIFIDIQGRRTLEDQTTGLFILYIVGSVTMVIAILGAYGAHKESKVALIVFLVCMVIGCLLMLRYAVPAAIIHPQLDSIMKERYRKLLPLDKSSEKIKNMVEGYQTTFHCCGVFSYKDWEKIPDSCVCNQEEVKELCRTVSYNILMMPRKSVYTKNCFPIIMSDNRFIANTRLVVLFTLAILALLGMILSSVMIHLIKPTTLFKVPTVFSTLPSQYGELHSPPPY